MSGEIQPLSEINRSEGVGACEVQQLARFHPLFKGLFPAKFLVPQRNQWHCHLPEGIELLLPTGTVRRLPASSPGAPRELPGSSP